LDDRQQAHVLIRYFVPPTATEKFLDAWNKAEKGVEDDEKGVHIYSLRKVYMMTRLGWVDQSHWCLVPCICVWSGTSRRAHHTCSVGRVPSDSTGFGMTHDPVPAALS